jgi:hypothetical protein
MLATSFKCISINAVLPNGPNSDPFGQHGPKIVLFTATNYYPGGLWCKSDSIFSIDEMQFFYHLNKRDNSILLHKCQNV